VKRLGDLQPAGPADPAVHVAQAFPDVAGAPDHMHRPVGVAGGDQLGLQGRSDPDAGPSPPASSATGERGSVRRQEKAGMALRVRDRQVREIGNGWAGVWRVWGPAWLGMLALAFANGTARALGYQPVVGETTARQIATVTLLGLLGGYVWVLHRRAPLPDTGTAAAVGGRGRC
jgi:hypothetical protein